MPDKLKKAPVALLDLSAAKVSVGLLRDKECDCIYLCIEENSEPIYFNTTEASLLVAALEVSIRNLES